MAEVRSEADCVLPATGNVVAPRSFCLELGSYRGRLGQDMLDNETSATDKRPMVDLTATEMQRDEF